MLGALHLHVDTSFEHRWSILFGASGSGKSSVLRALCGLLPKAGAKLLRGDPPGERNVDLTAAAPHRRRIAYAPQQAALFPYLTARGNIGFSSALGEANNSELVEEALDLFELRSLAERMPSNLSGGERQRVNLARAFAMPRARLVLLDEPFTGLDLKLRDRLLPGMQRLLAARSLPCISVTHDVDEALLAGAEVFRIDAGRIVAHGPARVVLAEERARLLATLQATETPEGEA
jgi:ABC-type sulfate/molybdate transport systems ATPase subunit